MRLSNASTNAEISPFACSFLKASGACERSTPIVGLFAAAATDETQSCATVKGVI
jgi:hypothetical protein